MISSEFFFRVCCVHKARDLFVFVFDACVPQYILHEKFSMCVLVFLYIFLIFIDTVICGHATKNSRGKCSMRFIIVVYESYVLTFSFVCIFLIFMHGYILLKTVRGKFSSDYLIGLKS